MSAITAKASRKMKKYAVLTREPRCFLGSFDFSWEQRKFDEVFDCTVPNNTLSRAELSYDEGTVLNVHYGDVLIKYGSVLDVQKDDIPRIPHRCREDFNGALLQDGDVIIADTAEDETTGKACEIGNLQGSAIVSGLHTMVCRPRNRMALGYLGYYLNSNAYHHQLLPLMQGIKVLSLSRSNIQKTSVSYPIAVKEQQLIAYYFSQLDNLITLHQRKCVFLFGFFQAFISMIFTASTFSWEQRKLGDVGETYTGLSGKTKADFGHGQARFVTYMNVFSNPISNPEMTEPIEIDPKQNEVEVGDVFFTTSSETPEEVGMSSVLLEKRGKIYLNSFCFGFRPTEKIDSYYLAYMLRSESAREKIILLAQGISRYNISKNKVMEIAVSLPSLDEQKLIGQYFRQLDNLITLHQRECISFTARAGRRILTANKKRNTSSWEQRKVSDLAEKTYGGGTPTTSNEAYWNGDIPWIQSSDVVDGKLLGVEPRKWITQDGLNNSAAQLIPGNSIAIITRVGVGKLAFMPYSYATSQDFLSLSKLNAEPLFTVYACYKKLQSELNAVQGTSIKGITKDELLAKNIMVPRYAEQQQIGAFFKQLDNLITLHQRKPFLMKWRTSDANRNKTNRLVL